MTDLSLSEVEATVKKAARGCGYGWGLAGEAAFAARWLCAQQLDGCGLMAWLLKAVDEGMNPDTCPLRAGTQLSDTAHRLLTPPVQFPLITIPALLLPFAASTAQATGQTISIEWQNMLAVTDGTALSLQSTGSAQYPEASEVIVSPGGVLTASAPAATRARPDDNVWQTLLTYAHRTYAPMSEQSRLSGAGAGTSDND